MSTEKLAVTNKWVTNMIGRATAKGVEPSRALRSRKRLHATNQALNRKGRFAKADVAEEAAGQLQKARQGELASGAMPLGGKAVAENASGITQDAVKYRNLLNSNKAKSGTSFPGKPLSKDQTRSSYANTAEILERKHGVKVAAMDHELATSVISRYQSGLPVDEAMFFKAAHAIGADPYDALLEARFATMLSFDTEKMASGERLSSASLAAYSAAVGEDPRVMHKTASRYGLDPERLVMLKLAEQNWVPNLEMLKVAMMAEGGGMGAEQMQAPMMDPAAAGGGAAQPPMPPPDGMGPQPGAAVQQRYKPSPMAPMQTPPSPEGNLQELSEAARHPDAAADAMASQQQPGGSMGPEGSPDSMGPDAGPGMEQQAPPEPPPMTPDQKIQQVDPSVDQETMARWAPKLEEIEQQTGIQMNDPQQIQKFVAEMQKADSKTLDEAIKAMNTPQPLNKPSNPNSPAAQQGGQESAPPPAQEKVAMRRAYLP